MVIVTLPEALKDTLLYTASINGLGLTTPPSTLSFRSSHIEEITNAEWAGWIASYLSIDNGE